MGYDGDIMLFNLDEYYDYLPNQLKVLHSVNEFMGDKVPRNIKLMIEETESLIFWKNELKKSPEENEGRLHDLLTFIKFYPPMLPTRHNLHRYHLWGWKTAIVVEKFVPDFLTNYSQRANELWAKMIGDESLDKIIIKDEEFLLKRGNRIGFIFGEELNELAKELKPILPYTNMFYLSLAEQDKKVDYSDTYAVTLKIIELVYILCIVGTSDINTNPILAYINDQASG